MEENNTTSQNENENDESKKEKNVKTKKPKQEAKSERDGFKDYKAEFDRIIWLKKDELAKKTVTVIITSLLVGVIIFCMDAIYSGAYNLVLSLIG